MKRILTSNLVPGMTSAEDVYSFNNQLIIPKNTILTDKVITSLEYYSITSIRIDDSIPISNASVEVPEEPDSVQASGVTPKEAVPFSKMIQDSPEFQEFQETFQKSVVEFKSSLNEIVQRGALINTDELISNTLGGFNLGDDSFQYFNYMQNMRKYDDLTYAHCINVALISQVLAGWLNFDEKEVRMAGLCGLLHDIGKLAIPDKIIKKPSKLTDEEYKIIKTHTIKGYEILKKQYISQHIKNSALMHHEKCDGTGYPLRLTGEKIDKFAKIVAIADVYDAMTAARVYRGPLCPFTVIEIFEKEGLQHYESEYILTFLEHVVMTYMNNRVKLSDDREGDVVFINKAHLSKPMVKCGDTFVDLSAEKDLSIVEIL